MSDKIFFDTNIIVYVFDKEDARKNKTAINLLDSFYFNENYLISTQVLLEFCNVAYRKMKPALSGDEIDKFISSFSDEKIALIDKGTIKKAIQVKEQYQFSFWDSLIIATALFSGCNKLYSEDMTDGQIIEDLVIYDPFKN
jgi:predicted nucleic acid-binding protein